MPQSTAQTVRDFRSVFTFAFVTHLADVITTHYRDPHLAGEGNPLFTLLASRGIGGWAALILVKVAIVGVLSAAYWGYLTVRRHYLPDEEVHSPRSLIWRGMWDGRPYPRSLWRRVFNLRKFEFGGVVMMAIALPASAVAALFISVDNVLVAVGNPLPYLSLRTFIPLTTVGMFVWWNLAYWQYYQRTLQDNPPAPGE